MSDNPLVTLPPGISVDVQTSQGIPGSTGPKGDPGPPGVVDGIPVELAERLSRLESQVGVNLLTPAQSGFEDGSVGGWTAYIGSAVTNSTEFAASGLHSLRFIADRTTIHGVMLSSIPISASLIGQQVRVRAKVRSGSTAVRSMVVGTEAQRANGGTMAGTLSWSPAITAPPGQWVEPVNVRTVPDEAVFLRIYVAAQNPSVIGDATWVDDVMLHAETSPAAMQETINDLTNQLARSRQTALFNGSSTADAVVGPVGLGPTLAANGIDMRVRFAWRPEVFVPIQVSNSNASLNVLRIQTNASGGIFATGQDSTNTTRQGPTLTAAQLGNPNPGDWITYRATLDPAAALWNAYLSQDNGNTWQLLASAIQPWAGTAWRSDPLDVFRTWAQVPVAWADLRTLPGTPLASVDFTRPWPGRTYTDPQGNTWEMLGGGGAWINQGGPTQTSQRFELTSNRSVTVPAWATSADVWITGTGTAFGLTANGNTAVTPGQAQTITVGASSKVVIIFHGVG